MTGRTLQAHPKHVVLSMTKTAQQRVGWKCSCGHRLGGMDEPTALRTADAHLRFHEARGDTWTQEAGAL